MIYIKKLNMIIFYFKAKIFYWSWNVWKTFKHNTSPVNVVPMNVVSHECMFAMYI